MKTAPSGRMMIILAFIGIIGNKLGIHISDIGFIDWACIVFGMALIILSEEQ